MLLGLLVPLAGAQSPSLCNPPSLPLPAQPVGTLVEQCFTVTASGTGFVSGVQVLTMGTMEKDFQLPSVASSGFTCQNTSVTPGATCSQSATFTPSAPGLRMGAIVLLDANGNVLGVKSLSGIGQGGLGVLVSGNVQPVAGSGLYLNAVVDQISALNAELYVPTSVAMDGAGNLYIADSLHHRVRMVSAPLLPAPGHASPQAPGVVPQIIAGGMISTIAGNGTATWSGDNGPASAATLNTPSGLALDAAGNLYIADTGNNVVRRIAAVNGFPTGNITTVAGLGHAGYTGDSTPATAARLNQPTCVTVDASGNLYIADTGNQVIRRVDAATGTITTVAGNGAMDPSGDGEGTYSGDGGPAIAAGLNLPYAVAFDVAGNMYIPDSANNRIRRVAASNGTITGTNTITTIAGSGTPGYSGDGQAATAAELFAPSSVAIDAAGNFYIADTQNRAIRKVSVGNGFIETIVANGFGGYFDLTTNQLNPINLYGPMGLLLDGFGNLFFADSLNMRIREMQGNFVALNFTAHDVRQGSQSATIDSTIENDGNAPLELTGLTASTDAMLDSSATTCATGLAYELGVDGQCVVGSIFAPTPASSVGVLFPNIQVAGETANTPLFLQLVGEATLVNSTTTVLSSSLNPSGYGQNLTLTATVTTGAGTSNLTGTVTFMDGATVLNPTGITVSSSTTGQVTTGVATYTTGSFSVGLHTITAIYNVANGLDDNHFSSTAAPLVQTVQEGTTTVLASSQNPSALGQSVTFTATVTASNGGGVALDGTVAFANGNTTLCAAVPLTASGTASCASAALLNGINAITATYSGDTGIQVQGSGPVTLNQDVLAPSTTALGSSLNPSHYGIPVTFTAVMTPTSSVAVTGTVNFLDAGAQIGSVGVVPGPSNTGTASFTLPTLIAGQHTITAAYLGDQYNAPSTSATLTQTVDQAVTATAVLITPNPGIAGAPEVLMATVTVTLGAGSPTGTVTFTDGSTTLGTHSISPTGVATLSVTLTPGQHSIVATYSGDANDAGSASATLPFTVVQATTSTVLNSNPNPSIVLLPVVFAATVTGNGGIPSGSVNFLADGSSLGSSNLDAKGVASLTSSAFVAGVHQITAVYAGDTNDAGSTSAALTQIVGTIPTVTDIGSATTPPPTPEIVLLATVVGLSGPTATGTVTFSSVTANGSPQIGAAPLDASGVATLIPNLPIGSYHIIATYGGDALHSSSVSLPVTISGLGAGFNLAVTPASLTLATTQNATVTVTLTSNSGFTDTIGLGCASLPAAVTCHFTALNVSLAANASPTVQLTIDTNNPLTGGSSAMNHHPGGLVLALLPFGLCFGCIFRRVRRRFAALLSVSLLLAGALLVNGCSGITQSSAAPGSYVIQVVGVGANSNISHYQNVTLTITK